MIFKFLSRKRANPPVISASSVQKGDTIRWAMRDLPKAAGRTHLMVVGSTGSGKTTLIRQFLQSQVPYIGTKEGANTRALIYDPKRDMLPIIHGMSPKCDVIILNPFDRRTHGWNIAADIRTPQHANAIAAILIPDEKGSSQPFFTNAARSLLASVMAAMALKVPGRWSLRDVIIAMRAPERIRAVTKLHPSTFDRAKVYLDDKRPLMSILSTAATRLDQMEIVAALWEKAGPGRTFSLNDWLLNESILVLGASPANRASLDPINLAIFRRLTDLLLDQPDDPSRYSWIVLDEIREAGRLDLSSILNQGRSKGACVLLGFQDVEGFQSVYEEKVANEICGQCALSAFLRTNSHKTAEWVEHHFGEALMREAQDSYTSSTSAQGRSDGTTVTYQRVIRKAVLASEVMGLPPTGPENGLTGFFDIPGKPIERLHASWAIVQSQLLEKSTASEHEASSNWDMTKPEDQLLKPWVKEDLNRLGITIEQEAPSEAFQKLMEYGS